MSYYHGCMFQRENFPFLEEYRCSRSRTTFYYTLGYLIFMEDSPVKFKTSMEPLLQVHVRELLNCFLISSFGLRFYFL
jgi:hypothetical protein